MFATAGIVNVLLIGILIANKIARIVSDEKRYCEEKNLSEIII